MLTENLGIAPGFSLKSFFILSLWSLNKNICRSASKNEQIKENETAGDMLKNIRAVLGVWNQFGVINTQSF